MDEETMQMLLSNPALLQAALGQMGGRGPASQANFNPEVVDLMGDAQGFDAEDERIARQRARADALRGSSQNPVDAPKSSGAWAQGLANVANAGMAAYKDRKLDTRQGEADRQRRIGNRNMFAARGGIAPMTSTRGDLPMQQFDTSQIAPPKQRSF